IEFRKYAGRTKRRVDSHPRFILRNSPGRHPKPPAFYPLPYLPCNKKSCAINLHASITTDFNRKLSLTAIFQQQNLPHY
ncbi:MAG: hypothetical protein IKA22_12025, partial [Lentisphaeria bacterium]|nr:hypothetical protein [Lentisphaeria bacterium]